MSAAALGAIAVVAVLALGRVQGTTEPGRVRWVAAGVRAHPARRRAKRAEVEAIADLVDDLVRAVRGGAALGPSLADVAATGAAPALRRAGDAVQRGMPVADAVDAWADALGHPDARMVADAVAVVDAVGGSAAPAMAAAAEALRADLAVQRQVRAAAAQARLSAAVLGGAPAAMSVVTAITAPDAVGYLVGEGVVVLVVAAVLYAVGIAWMGHLVRRVR